MAKIIECLTRKILQLRSWSLCSFGSSGDLISIRLIQLSVLIITIVLMLAPSEAQEVRGVTLADKAASSVNFGTYHAVIIGINGYKEWPQLRFAEKDAADLRQLLINRYNFASEHVVYLAGPAGTRSNILREVRDKLEGLNEDDNLLIYYAGHGQLDPLTDTGYWIPVDGSLKDESSWVSLTEIRTLLTGVGVKAKSILILTDSCYGGALARSGPTPGHHGPEDLGYEQYLEQLKTLGTKHSRQVIASGGFEKVPDRSYFADLLKQALEANLYPFVDMEFIFFTKIYPELRFIGHQEPTLVRLVSGPKEDGQFVLTKKDAVVRPPEPATPSIQGVSRPLVTLRNTETTKIRGEEFVVYNLTITNWSDFAPELFQPAPDLPPCGLNKNASRTWVTIYDDRSDRAIYGYCGLKSPNELSLLSFSVKKGDKPPEKIYILIEDRRKGIRYRSESVNTPAYRF